MDVLEKSLDKKLLGPFDKYPLAPFEFVEAAINRQDKLLVSSLHFFPDLGEPNKGLIANYEIRVGVSKDAVNQLVKSGEFSNIQNNPVMQSVFFTPVKARYIELKATRMIRAGEPMGFAELRVK